MDGPVLYVYRLPEGKGAEFEALLSPARGEEAVRQFIKDRTSLLAFLQEHESDGIYEDGRLVSLSAAEIVQRCCRLRTEHSGPVTVSVHRP